MNDRPRTTVPRRSVCGHVCARVPAYGLTSVALVPTADRRPNRPTDRSRPRGLTALAPPRVPRVPRVPRDLATFAGLSWSRDFGGDGRHPPPAPPPHFGRRRCRVNNERSRPHSTRVSLRDQGAPSRQRHWLKQKKTAEARHVAFHGTRERPNYKSATSVEYINRSVLPVVNKRPK